MADLVDVATLQFDERVWPRLARNTDRVGQLADRLEAGEKLPALKVDRKTRCVLSGWHTAAAYERRGQNQVPVEWVRLDEDPAAALRFAYHVDEKAALPPTDADVQSVATRLYQLAVNGDEEAEPNVSAIAKELGRARQTVDRWLEDLVRARQEKIRIFRAARAVAIHSYLKTGISQRQVAEAFGISKTEVVRIAQASITDHLGEPPIIDRAISLISTAHDRTPLEAQAAREWLTAQTDPTQLRTQQAVRVLAGIDGTLSTQRAALQMIDIAMIPSLEGLELSLIQPRRQQILDAIDTIVPLCHEIRRRVE
jgi:predicted transcriptional regulator